MSLLTLHNQQAQLVMERRWMHAPTHICVCDSARQWWDGVGEACSSQSGTRTRWAIAVLSLGLGLNLGDLAL